MFAVPLSAEWRDGLLPCPSRSTAASPGDWLRLSPGSCTPRDVGQHRIGGERSGWGPTSGLTTTSSTPSQSGGVAAALLGIVLEGLDAGDQLFLVIDDTPPSRRGPNFLAAGA